MKSLSWSPSSTEHNNIANILIYLFFCCCFISSYFGLFPWVGWFFVFQLGSEFVQWALPTSVRMVNEWGCSWAQTFGSRYASVQSHAAVFVYLIIWGNSNFFTLFCAFLSLFYAFFPYVIFLQRIKEYSNF